MRIQAFCAAATLAFVLVAASPGSGQAADATLTWSFQSNHPNRVQLEFYSQHRNAAWPGNGHVFLLGDSVDGDANQYWGVGIDQSSYCQDCCVICQNGDAGTRTLNP